VKELGGLNTSIENFSTFVDYDLIIKEFDIKEEEMRNDLGLNGAIYNRLALKDLK
jgi:hypothetical protein